MNNDDPRLITIDTKAIEAGIDRIDAAIRALLVPHEGPMPEHLYSCSAEEARDLIAKGYATDPNDLRNRHERRKAKVVKP